MGVAAEVEMEIVVEGDPDASVKLDAVLKELRRRTCPTKALAALTSSPASRLPVATACPAASLMAWLASSQVFMSAKRCLSSW